MVELTTIGLPILNWFHLIATVVWIGAMSTNFLILLPSLNEALGPGPAIGKMMAAIMKRFRPIVYLSIITLTVTGSLMFYLNENYEGLLVFGNTWTIVIALKHVFVASLVILAVYSFEVLAPKVGKLAAKGPSPELAKLQKLQLNLAKSGFALGIIILLFTGISSSL